jgi:hypothetical protein
LTPRVPPPSTLGQLSRSRPPSPWRSSTRVAEGCLTPLLPSPLRANPCPEVTDPFCRLPLSTFSYQREASHLGDLMRLSVRPGVPYTKTPPRGGKPAQIFAPLRRGAAPYRGFSWANASAPDTRNGPACSSSPPALSPDDPIPGPVRRRQGRPPCSDC